MRTYCIVSRKGGVGKTESCRALGAGLRRKGKRVLLIDLDSQANLSYTMGIVSDIPGACEMLYGELTAKEAIQHTKQGDIIPGSSFLSGADLHLNGKGKEYILKKALEPVKRLYDYCVIDTSAQLSTLAINALTASDCAILPVQADIYSMKGAGLVYDAINTVKQYTNKSLKIEGILITRYDSRTIISRDMRENIEHQAKAMHTKVFSTPIRSSVSIQEAAAKQTDIFTYAPRSNGAKDYEAFVEEVLKGGSK